MKLTIEDREKDSLGEMLVRLREITNKCRLSMHEPDEQGVRAFIIGDDLDNACGEYVDIKALSGGYQELIVVLSNDDKGTIQRFNLASLIALARLAEIS